MRHALVLAVSSQLALSLSQKIEGNSEELGWTKWLSGQFPNPIDLSDVDYAFQIDNQLTEQSSRRHDSTLYPV